ncbi:hypothetical protein TRVA0_008S00496 [Trichomonascus vanleenenianus]|uniref:uncharacterized protein n=1 Tax=Trichomonascus vanleenenianus TaxID=2268995 RepID=UPI003ECA767A
MGLRSHAKRLRRPKESGGRLATLPEVALTLVAELLSTADRCALRLTCQAMEKYAAIELYKEVKFDLAALQGSQGSFDRIPDHGVLQTVSTRRPESRIAIRRRNDLYYFCLYAMTGRTTEYLKCTESLCVRVSALTFGFGRMTPHDAAQLKAASYTEHSQWVVEEAPRLFPGLVHLEILASTFDGTVQHMELIMKLLERFSAAEKSITSAAYIRRLAQDPEIPNVTRYKVNAKTWGANMSVPRSVRHLDLTATDTATALAHPVEGEALGDFLRGLDRLEALTLTGISVVDSIRNAGSWLPPSVRKLEIDLATMTLKTTSDSAGASAGVASTVMTFPNVLFLKLHLAEEQRMPLDGLSLPRLRRLYIHDRAAGQDIAPPEVRRMDSVKELHLDVHDVNFVYVASILASLPRVERLILNGTFQCQQFLRESARDVLDAMQVVIAQATSLRSVVLHCGVEHAANLAIVRSFMTCPLLVELFLYPASEWTSSVLTPYLYPVWLRFSSKDSESAQWSFQEGFMVDLRGARNVSDGEWLGEQHFDLSAEHDSSEASRRRSIFKRHSASSA